MVAALLASSAPAQASFTRHFLRQITRAENLPGPPETLNTKPCTEAEAAAPGSPCLNPSQVGVNAENDLLVENNTSAGGAIDKLASAPAGNGFIPPPESGSLPGAFGRRTETCFMAECTVYVTESGGTATAVKRFKKVGLGEEPDEFTCGAACASYVKGNEIVGRPSGTGCGESFAQFADGEVRDPTVDSKGDIYVRVPPCNSVFEYEASGKYLQAFDVGTNPEVPTLGPELGRGETQGIALDPISGHLLVSVFGLLPVAGGKKVGAVDEFDRETGKFVDQLTQTSEGGRVQDAGSLAVDSLGDVYLADPEQRVVDVWESGAYFPTVKLGATTGRTETSAVLTGSVDPEQEGNSPKASVTECFFQYVPQKQYEEEKGSFTGVTVQQEASCVPAAGSIKEAGVTAVSAKLTGLQAGVTYRYRLVATTDKTKNGGTSDSEALAFTAPHAPEVISSAAQNVSSTFADLHAQINPLGAATSYHFEYDTRAYAAGEGPHGTTIPVPDATIGEGGPTGSAAEAVLQHIGPLTPATTYYFRVVAVNEAGSTVGPDRAFTTLAEARPGLPDNRGYEIVTPIDKQGGSDMFDEPVDPNGNVEDKHSGGVPSETGEAFLFKTESTFGEFPFGLGGDYVFRREPANGKWSFTSLASPSLGVQGPVNGVVFDPADFSRVAFNDGLGTQVGEQGIHVANLLGPPGAGGLCQGMGTLQAAVSLGCYLKLYEGTTAVHAHPTTEGSDTTFVGGSQDLEHVILESKSAATCPDPLAAAEKVTHGNVLCESTGGYETLEDGEVRPALQLVNLAPGSESTPTSTCGAAIAAGGPAFGSAHNAVSGDGSRVFFTSPDPPEATAPVSGPGCWNGDPNERGEGVPVHAPQLYARVETGDGAHEVLDVSEPEPGVTETGGPGGLPLQYPAVYVGASADGSKVFFLTRTWMTQNHPEGHDSELYECEIPLEEGPPACKLSRVSVPIHEAGKPGAGTGAQALFVPAVSADASTVYFTAFSVLAPGSTRYTPEVKEGTAEVKEGTAEVKEGTVNLYRYDTLSGTTSYVAPVDVNDYTDEPECAPGIPIRSGLGGIGPCSLVDWYTTPDGRYLLFGASTSIEGYNAVAGGCAEHYLPFTQGLVDGRCSELYRYSAAAAERGEPAVVCVSCGSSGADSAGNAEFARSGAFFGPASGAVRAMSNDGSYVFFDTLAPLVPQATNHTLDTYEWHEGRVSLIGSGTDPAPTFFLGYSPYEYTPAGASKPVKVEGGNVFIGTHAKLLPQVTNSVGNIYDARVCESESPCIAPPAGETAQCEGGACQTPPALPLFQSPATNTLSSSGNITAEPSAPKPKAKPKPKCKKVKKRGKEKTVCAGPEKKAKAKKSAHTNRRASR